MSTNLEHAAPDAEVLGNLLAQKPSLPQSAVAGVEPVERPQARRKTTKLGVADIMAYLAAGALAVFGWVIGGYFTLTALVALGLPIVAQVAWPWELTSAALVAWLVPLGISALELAFFRRGWQFAVFALVALLDLLSTVYGIAVALGGRALPLGMGMLLAQGSTGLWVVAIAAALLLTFGPERLALAVSRALLALVR